MLQLNYRQIMATNEMLKRLIRLKRWTDIMSDDSFNEMAKQALNSLICYILACFAEAKGEFIDWTRFPKYALYRAYEKVYVVFNTPKSKYLEIFQMGAISPSEFEKATKRKIAEVVDPEFSEFLSDSLGTIEAKIFKAATTIATYIELLQLQNRCEPTKYSAKLRDVLDEMAKCKDIPGFKEVSDTNGNLFTLLQFISDSYLRHHTRWCELGYVQPCTILGHLYSTAVWAYFMSLEEHPEDEALATKRYFMGIFHDLAEGWTTDLPSPIKDYIKGLREACESFEDKVLHDNIYSKVPDFVAEKIHEVMFEEPENVQAHKAIIKGADYLSADTECWLQYQLGSRDPYFWGAILRRQPGIDNGSVALTPLCGKLRQYFKDFCRTRCNLEKPLECEHWSDDEFNRLAM